MGASLSAAEVERNDELLQRHLVRVRETGYTDIEGVDSTIYSLYENHCFQLDSTKLIVSHKIFVKREEPEKMKLIEENHKYINDSISVNAHPYFLLSKSIKFVNPNQKESDKVQDLPVLSRQHIRWTLQEKLLSGLSLSYQEKLNIAIQIVIAGMVLHEGLNEKEDSNVLLTSDSIVYLADFAAYKPLYMDHDKLGDNKLFHPNLLERSYIAPEKLNAEKASQTYTYSKLDKQTITDLQQMDIFSIGCILAEIFMSDNNALFEYPSIIKYRQEGDKSPLERINTIPHPEIKDIILKMLSLDPKERGTLKDYLPMFEKCVPKSLLTLYAYLNYVFRRSEFVQPDQKLGLIRLVAPLLLSDMQKELTPEENASLGAMFEGIKFRRCFPYHISRLGILGILKTIVNSCPLNSFFNKETIIKYLDETGAAIQSNDMTVEAAKNPMSSIYLEGAKFLRESPLNLDQKPYTKDEVFYQEGKDTEFNPKQTFKRIIVEAQEEHKRNQLLERFSPICQLLETILSLIRNLQLSQSYLVGLELIEILSLFVSSEWITCIIFPHLHYRIEQQKSDFMEVRFSVKLFCELISRIRLVKPILAKRSAFVSYIKPLYDTCKEDPSLSIFIIRSVSDFIKANLTLLLLQEVFKTVTINGKQDMDISAISKVDPDRVVEEILASDKIANSPNKFTPLLEQDKFFLPLLHQGLRTEATAFEVLRSLPKVYGYFSPQFVNVLARELLVIQNKTLDAAFRSDALVLIGSIMHYLPIENVRDFILHVKSCKFAPEEYTEMANAIKALTTILGHKDLTFLDKCEILESEKLFSLCPCTIVQKNALKLIETVYESCTEDEITQAISPILSHLTDRMPAPDFETFELERYPPVTYLEYQRLVNTKKGYGTEMGSDNMAKYFEIVDQRLVIQKKQPTNASLSKRDFYSAKNLPRYIQEVLGCIAIFQIFKKAEEATNERNELLKKFESKDNSMTKEQSLKYLLKYFSDKLNNDSSGLSFNIRIDTRFTNTTDNYVKLSNVKEEIVDQLSVKVDYKYIQQFNLSVLKIAMNYIQLLLNLTKFKSVTNRGNDSRSIQGDIPAFVNKLRKWRPAGHLCTTINAHSKAVKSLAVINSQAFASGSHDGHVKLHSLPAISRNFIHNSIEDVDINKDAPDSEPKRVNQVISLNKVSKIAIVNTSNQLLLCDDNKPKKLIQYDCKSRPTAATAYASDWLSNCIGCVTTDCEFLLWDVRQKKPAMQHNLSKIRGVPSSIARIGGLNSDYSTVITTHKGYVVNHDLRTNLTLFTRRLTMEGKSMPITSVAEFIPTTAFKNMSFQQRYILLTYPSKSNQFSIFPLGQEAKQAASPLVMFESGIDNKTSKPTDSPTLEDVSRKEEPLDFDGICDERFEYLNRVIQQPDNQFAIGNSFAIRSVASSSGLYRDNFHNLKMKIKKECLKNFEDIMQMQASISEYNMTINKVLCLPGVSRERLKGEFEIDNILLTCGTDKNVRFLNFGNGLEKRVQDNLEYEYYNCYHLSNTDNMSRAFKFSYCHNMYLLKESPMSNTSSQSAINETLNNGQGPQKFMQNGLSQYHNQFLGSRKNADILPGHSANVTDILFVDNPETPLVITASDDSLIKIWS